MIVKYIGDYYKVSLQKNKNYVVHGIDDYSGWYMIIDEVEYSPSLYPPQIFEIIEEPDENFFSANKLFRIVTSEDIKSNPDKYNKLERLKAGENVICSKCKIGFYIPFNTDVKSAHTFKCNNCDSSIHCDPMVIIE